MLGNLNFANLALPVGLQGRQFTELRPSFHHALQDSFRQTCTPESARVSNRRVGMRQTGSKHTFVVDMQGICARLLDAVVVGQHSPRREAEPMRDR